MTKSSPSRVARRSNYSDLTFGDVMPANTIYPEDIPTLFRATAEDLAGAFFEENKRSVRFRGHWKGLAKLVSWKGDVATFYVRKNWPLYLDTARVILAGMLQNPGVGLTLKDEIMDAFTAQAGDKRMLDYTEHLAPGAVN